MNENPKTVSVLPPPAGAGEELPPGECAALLGLDWGDKKHALALWVRASDRLETLELEHSAEALHAWLDQLRERCHGQRGCNVRSEGVSPAASARPRAWD